MHVSPYVLGQPSRKVISKGFTLIEILLVVLILMVLLGVSVPHFSSTVQQITLKKSTEDLASLMRYAQSRAVTKNQRIRLQFEDDFSRYQLLQNVSLQRLDQVTSFQRISGRFGRKFEIPRKVSVASEMDIFDFFPDGTMERNQIQLCQNENCYTISTLEQRGFIHVYPTEGSG